MEQETKKKIDDNAVNEVLSNFEYEYMESQGLTDDDVDLNLESFDVGLSGCFYLIKDGDKPIGSVLLLDSSKDKEHPESTLILSAYYDAKGKHSNTH